MPFNDIDTNNELTKLGQQIAAMGQQLNVMSGQLTTALVQQGELRGEMAGMRRDLDRIHAERRGGDVVQSPILGGWNTFLLMLLAALVVSGIMVAVYFGGRSGL